MEKFEKSIITFTIIFSPILIMGRPIVGGVSEAQDYYTILGLSENSSQDDVLRAYYRLSQMYKTGNTNDPDAQQKLQKIIEGNFEDSFSHSIFNA